MTYVRDRPADLSRLTDNLRSHALVSVLAGELGEALRSLDRAADVAAKGWTRQAVNIQRAQAWLWFELGRRDLALRQLAILAQRDDLLPGERLSIDATRMYVGDPAIDAAAMLEAAGACEDLLMRCRVLSLAHDGCDAEAALRLLASTAALAREQGAHGLWLGLQGPRVAALLRLGRVDEARAQALETWRRAEQGLVGMLPFPRLAAPLCAALAPGDADLAQVIALQAAAWIQRAGASLPQPWRDSYLRRARALRDSPSPNRLAGGASGAQEGIEAG